MFSSCRAVRLFSNDESTSAITETHPNVDRTSLSKLCNPHHLNYFAICERHNTLHIIYGSEYTCEENLLFAGAWVEYQTSLALCEFALGIEALERFVRAEPLRRVHECAFGILGERANQ
jgi:hypothetical protein